MGQDLAFDWDRFDRELLFPGLDPGIAGVGDSSFRALTIRMELPKGCAALDVGAGGFAGHTTTRHLVEVLDARIDAVEIDADLARKLDEKFGGRIAVHTMAIQDFPKAGRMYDVIVFDLPMIPWQMDHLVPDWLDHLRPGGYFVLCMIYDLAAMFDGKEPLMALSNRPEFEAFMLRRFGTTTLDPRTAQKAFVGTPLTVRAIVDKWSLRSERRGFGFIVLQKDGPSLRPVPLRPDEVPALGGNPSDRASPARPAGTGAPGPSAHPSIFGRIVAGVRGLLRG